MPRADCRAVGIPPDGWDADEEADDTEDGAGEEEREMEAAAIPGADCAIL